MGRESRFLLAILGLLAGVFIAALVVRLLSPRPPRGAGPDIQLNAAAAVPTPIVSPPDLAPGPRPTPALTPTAGPTATAAAAGGAKSALPLQRPRDLPDLSPVPRAGTQPSATAGEPRDNPSAAPGQARLVSNTEPQPGTPPGNAAPPWERTEPQPIPRPPAAPPPFSQPPAAPAAPPPAVNAASSRPPSAGPPPVVPGENYRVGPDDSWWSIAERAYGDGRYYRSLFAWNRTVQPRVTLAVGTTLEIPPVSRLQLAWPRLVPVD